MTTSQKITAVVLIALGIALFYWGRSCGVKAVLKTAGSDTVVIRDTVSISTKPQVSSVDSSRNTTAKRKLKLWQKRKPVILQPIDTTGIDTTAIIEDWYLTRFYTNKYKIGRSEITIIDTVTTNEIVGRGINIVTADSVITKTIVLRPPRKVVGYVTGSLMVGPKIYGMGAGLALKFSNDLIIQSEYKITNQMSVIEARVMLPIRLVKNPFK